MRLLLLIGFALALASPTLAQGVPLPTSDEPAEPPPPPRPAPPVAQPAPPPLTADITRYGPRRLGGPRTGFTILSRAVADKINETFPGSGCPDAATCENPRIDPTLPIISQFGWQFERRIFQAESGLTGMTEWVFLVGGAERGLLLPSATFLAGVRTPSGLEIGVGPNVSLSGAAYAFAVG